MNTVGFGDIVATNNMEIIFTIIFVFIGCAIFAIRFIINLFKKYLFHNNFFFF